LHRATKIAATIASRLKDKYNLLNPITNII
jgi:hypothetical protein